jgi:hypothetical protein
MSDTLNNQPFRLRAPLTPEQVEQLDQMIQELYEGAGGGSGSGIVDLTTDVTGVLPIANGGTNSGTPLSGNTVMFSNGTAIVQGAVLSNSAGQYFGMPTITAPSTPASGYNDLYAFQENGHTLLHSLDQDGSDLVLLRDNIILVRNTSGGSLTKGTAVDIYAATGQVPNVRAADNTIAAQHCEGVLQETIANNGFGLAVTLGYVKNIDTSAFSDGDVLYVGTAGALTKTQPTFPGGARFIQRVGVVVYSHATQGIVFVFLNDIVQIPPASTFEAYISLRIL